MRSSKRILPPFLLAIALAAPLAAAEQTPAPARPAAEKAPPAESLLELGRVPPQAVSRKEPPVVARPDARVFVYGERIPRIRCMPYRACTLLLAPDETVLHVALGDSERWQLEDFSGSGAPALVLKPDSFNLSTNLVVHTDRRLYVVELLSPKPPKADPRDSDAAYDALVEFSYPHTWSRTLATPPAAKAPPAAASAAPGSGPDDLHFAYDFKRPVWPSHRLGWTPDIVYDDGHRTFVHLPPKARHRDLPAVVVVGDDGKPAPTDTTLGGPDSQWLIVPTVAPRLQLLSGDKDKTRRLTLVRVGG